MTCGACLRPYRPSENRCPHCDAPNPDAGFFQTSAVIISEHGGNRVYQSMAAIPARLRTRLKESTNGENSAVILIADRRGREEITKALRSSVRAGHSLAAQSIPGETAAGPLNWFGRFPWRRKALAVLIVFSLAVLAALSRHWR